MTQSTDTAQNFLSFLDTNTRRRVFIFDFQFLSTTPGIDDFVAALKRDNVTPVVITHYAASPNFGDLMNAEYQCPMDLPTFNLEPGADISVGDLISHARGREIAGCASDFSFDTTLAQATLRAGGIAFACRDRRPFGSDPLPNDTHVIAHLNQARTHRHLQQRLAGN